MEDVEAHDEQEQAGEGRVDEHRPCFFREPPALPRLDTVLKLPHRGAQVSKREPSITNGYPQISRGEAPKLAVKPVRYALSLILGVAQDHNLTLVEVDSKAGHLLEAQ